MRNIRICLLLFNCVVEVWIFGREPPRIPLAGLSLHLLHRLHLSPIDEKFVADYLSLITQESNVDIGENGLDYRIQWGFAVICDDFGPGLFCQRSELFEVCILHVLSFHFYFKLLVLGLFETSRNVSFNDGNVVGYDSNFRSRLEFRFSRSRQYDTFRI
jgi:hypothetical protein